MEKFTEFVKVIALLLAITMGVEFVLLFGRAVYTEYSTPVKVHKSINN